MSENWGLRTTMIRYNYISLYSGTHQYKYFIIKKEANAEDLPLGYIKVPIETKALDLYINKDLKETND